MKHTGYRIGKNLKAAMITLAVCVMTLPIMATAQSVKLNVKDTTGTDKFVVTDSGYVGIGTNNPVSPIHVINSTATSTQIRTHLIASTTNGGGGFLGYFNYPNYGLPLAGDRLGYFLFGALDTDGATGRNGAGLQARAEQNWVSGLNGSTYSGPTYLTFETTDTGSRVERIRVTAAGNFGVGTTAPAQKMEVNGGVRLNTTTTRPVCDATTYAFVRGTIWVKQGDPGVKDEVAVCAKDASDVYGWKILY